MKTRLWLDVGVDSKRAYVLTVASLAGAQAAVEAGG